MTHILSGLLVAALPLSSATDDKPSPTPAQRYRELLKEFNVAGGKYRAAKTDQQRKAAVEQFGSFAAKFLDLAEKHPKDPIAITVLRQAVQALGSADSQAFYAWEVSGIVVPKRSKDKSAARIVAVLQRDHARSDKLDRVCERMRYGYRLEFEGFLRTVLKSSPHKNVRAHACLGLAQFLNDRLRLLQLIENRPDLANTYDVQFGKEYLQGLRRRDRAKLVKEIEALFVRAEAFGDVKLPFGGTVAEKAKSELYDLRNLAVGKPAPDIEGKDQDGRQFKLSDYRGKVVLLYFWVEF